MTEKNTNLMDIYARENSKNWREGVTSVITLLRKGAIVMGREYKIIAVDFDGTLVSNEYPRIGEPNLDLISYLIKRQIQDGDKVILWTCRVGKYLERAVKVCKKHGLYFDAVNENLPDVIESFGGDTRKIVADEYIDDRNVFCESVPYYRGKHHTRDLVAHIKEVLKKELKL